MKIGLLLGSFDPIHMGHLYMATSALNNHLVDKVIFIPSVLNPWKNQSTDFKYRCIMIQLAIESIDNCLLSMVDFNNKKPYYSYYTLNMLKDQYPNDELYIILGADIAQKVKEWYKGDWILENFKFILVARNGYDIPVDINKTLDISSTEIRNLAKENKQLYPLVPEIVNRYIKQYSLYK